MVYQVWKDQILTRYAQLRFDDFKWVERILADIRTVTISTWPCICPYFMSWRSLANDLSDRKAQRPRFSGSIFSAERILVDLRWPGIQSTLYYWVVILFEFWFWKQNTAQSTSSVESSNPILYNSNNIHISTSHFNESYWNKNIDAFPKLGIQLLVPRQCCSIDPTTEKLARSNKVFHGRPWIPCSRHKSQHKPLVLVNREVAIFTVYENRRFGGSSDVAIWTNPKYFRYNHTTKQIKFISTTLLFDSSYSKLFFARKSIKKQAVNKKNDLYGVLLGKESNPMWCV